MTRKIMVISGLVVFLLALGPVSAQEYRVDWNSVNSGGGSTSGGGYTVTGTVGQAAAGYSTNSQHLHWIGFWSGGELPVTQVSRAADAKLLPLGIPVTLVGKVATSAEDDFSSFFYVQDEDKSSGIRVAFPSGLVSGLLRGKSIVNVTGTTGLTQDDERQILASQVIVVSNLSEAVGPISVSNKWLGGGDTGAPPLGQYGVTGGAGVNNIGLLIRTFGTVQQVASGYMVISDGSPGHIVISTTGLTDLPQVGEFVAITGISSLYSFEGDRYGLVLPRQRSDIWPQ